MRHCPCACSSPMAVKPSANRRKIRERTAVPARRAFPHARWRRGCRSAPGDCPAHGHRPRCIRARARRAEVPLSQSRVMTMRLMTARSCSAGLKAFRSATTSVPVPSLVKISASKLSRGLVADDMHAAHAAANRVFDGGRLRQHAVLQAALVRAGASTPGCPCRKSPSRAHRRAREFPARRCTAPAFPPTARRRWLPPRCRH